MARWDKTKSRREFLNELAMLGVGAALSPLLWEVLSLFGKPARAGGKKFVPAEYWEKVGDRIRCTLCPRKELLKDGEYGYCRSRQNVGGRLVSHGYNQPCVLNVDPIEKGPLAHVLPGADALSVAHAGCNLRCLYCQNWQYSQKRPDETKNVKDFDQAKVIAHARKRDIKALTFTYTEPAVLPEFVIALAKRAREKKLRTTLCTAGYIEKKPFRKMLDVFDAVTITLKGSSEKFYKKVVDGGLRPVLDALLLAKEEKKWLEVATLIVPGLNDDEKAITWIAKWIVKNLGKDTPWHIERFQPQYKLRRIPETPRAKMEAARRIGLDAGLRYVYISNMAPHEGNHTYCPECKKPLIKRLGLKILKNDLKDGACPHCGAKLPGIWS